MVLAAIAGSENFTLDDTALRQAGPVYTADTMQLLKSTYPAAEFSFIAGADSRYRELTVANIVLTALRQRLEHAEPEHMIEQPPSAPAPGISTSSSGSSKLTISVTSADGSWRRRSGAVVSSP